MSYGMNKEKNGGFSEDAYASEPRVYELGFHILPSVDEGNLEEKYQELVAIIKKRGGNIISEEFPALINLAYPMDKYIKNKRNTYDQAYFGWIKFEVDPQSEKVIKSEIEFLDFVLRFILIKTVRENTLFSENPYKLAKVEKENDEDEGFGELDSEADFSEEDAEEDTEDIREKEEVENTETQEEIQEKGEGDEADDLTKIEGIGPKIAEILQNAGIKTFADLSASKVGDLRDILAEHKLSSHDPKTWSKQATLAKHGKWDELKALQDELNGGRE